MHHRVIEGVLWFATLLGVPIGTHHYSGPQLSGRTHGGSSSPFSFSSSSCSCSRGWQARNTSATP
jgi:hypothetical protein